MIIFYFILAFLCVVIAVLLKTDLWFRIKQPKKTEAVVLAIYESADMVYYQVSFPDEEGNPRTATTARYQKNNRIKEKDTIPILYQSFSLPKGKQVFGIRLSPEPAKRVSVGVRSFALLAFFLAFVTLLKIGLVYIF